jgi:hypothetical protein
VCGREHHCPSAFVLSWGVRNQAAALLRASDHGVSCTARRPERCPIHGDDGMLYFMALLHASGEFKAYAPQ